MTEKEKIIEFLDIIAKTFGNDSNLADDENPFIEIKNFIEKQQEKIQSLESQLDFIGEQNKYIDKLEKKIHKQQKELEALDKFTREYGKLQLIPEDENGDIMTARVVFANNYYISKDKIREIISKKRTKALERFDNHLNVSERIFKKNIQVAMLDTLLKELLEEE